MPNKESVMMFGLSALMVVLLICVDCYSRERTRACKERNYTACLALKDSDNAKCLQASESVCK